MTGTAVFIRRINPSRDREGAIILTIRHTRMKMLSSTLPQLIGLVFEPQEAGHIQVFGP